MFKPPLLLKTIDFSFLCLIFFISACQNQRTSNKETSVLRTDSIQIWIDQSKLSETPVATKSYLLGKAQNNALSISNDSLKSTYLTQLSYRYYQIKDSLNFRKINTKSIQFNTRVRDSFNLAYAHWDLADFYNSYSIKDSAYYHYRVAQQTFEAIDKPYKSGQLLTAMARVQSEVGAYTSAEATIIKAIEKFKPLTQYAALSKCYSLLADNAKLLGETERALVHYDEALKYLEKAKGSPIAILSLKHDIALVYQKQGRHEKAISVFEEVLAFDSIYQKKARLCGRLLGNLGYSYLKTNQTEKLPQPFIKAIHIQDSINDLGGKSAVTLKLAEYYLRQKDSSSALKNLHLAKDLTTATGNSKKLLEVLRVLSRADPKNRLKYTEHYFALNDSLQLQERQILNKFGRIRFETDEFIAENEVLASEKQLWAGIAVSLILLGLASFTMINQRVKNRILKFREEQQANNQEIFNLMLAQGEKVEEGKKMEQKRVSEELHDGVLGKMLGARMMLIGLNKKINPEAIAERAKAISILQDVEGEVRSISHELSHAAYQKIHNFILSIKELVQTIQSSAKINIDFKFTEELDWDALSGEIKINLYRIVQESLQNSVKHAVCENIYINFYADEALLTIDIADDGKGFVQKREKKGIGMRNMSSRIKKVNGTWNIKSKVGKGTTVTFIIPLVSNDSENAPRITAETEPNLQEV